MPVSIASLRVPHAIDVAGRVVRPGDGSTPPHLCAGCGNAVGLRGGPGTAFQWHFYHLDDQVACAPETVLHRAAKRAIATAVNDHAAGAGPAPEILVVCGRATCRRAWYTPLPDWIERAEEEVALPSCRIADVGLFAGNAVKAAVEIRVTHAVDAAKASDLQTDGLRWIELDASECLSDPLHWHHVSGRPKEQVCPECVALDGALSDAGIPTWVKNLDPAGFEEDAVLEVLREGEIVILHARVDLHGEIAAERRYFHVRAARLRRPVRHDEWLRGLRAFADEARRTVAAKGLPGYVERWLVVDAALRHWGGAWLPGLDGHWRGRDERTDPDPARARWMDIRRIADETGQPIPPRESPYWAEPFRCYARRCRMEILVYSWKGKRWMDKLEPPASGRPGSIALRATKRSGTAYWLNVCPRCDEPQGENHVNQPAGPLRGRRPSW